MNYYHKKMKSPVGELKLITSDKGLVAILWEDDDPERIKIGETIEDNSNPTLLQTERQLAEYFAKTRTDFSLTLDFVGTDFQISVWKALLTIPFGQTRTYGQIAKQIGNPKAVRAVGAAANKNPISIITPCHRVIGGSGKLVGFAGGLENKHCLLRIESARQSPTLWD